MRKDKSVSGISSVGGAILPSCQSVSQTPSSEQSGFTLPAVGHTHHSHSGSLTSMIDGINIMMIEKELMTLLNPAASKAYSGSADSVTPSVDVKA